jgi:membrane protein implicated in regulation of membrane protease activity
MPDIVTTFLNLGPWAWIIAGAVLLALELAVPGAFMMWLGLAAVLVGIISFGITWSWQAQCVAFAVFALASVPLWRKFARKVDPGTDEPLLNRRTEAMVGSVYTLERAIVGGIGAVRIGDTIWRVSGADAPAGSRVKVIKADGADLMVEPA